MTEGPGALGIICWGKKILHLTLCWWFSLPHINTIYSWPETITIEISAGLWSRKNEFASNYSEL